MSRTVSLLALFVLAAVRHAFPQAPPPAMQAWSGWAQCQITIRAPGYEHNETHVWKVAGGPTKNGNMEISPMTWTVTGSGSLRWVSGPTATTANWTVNGMLGTLTVGSTLHLDRITIQRWTNHGPARGALTGTEVTTTNGVPRSRAVVLDVQQWAFPGVEGATTSARMTGSNSVPFDGLRGPLNPPSGAMGTAKCEWDFARSGSTASPPPTVPTSGGAAGTVGITTGGTATGGTATGTASGGSSASASGAATDLYADASPGPPGTLQADAGAFIGLRFVNFGPRAADGAMVKVATTGLFVAEVACTIFRAGDSSYCLDTGYVTAAQAAGGLAIPAFPSGGIGTIYVRGLVTAAVGSTVSVTLTTAPPAGMSDSSPDNNSYTYTATVVAADRGGSGTAGRGAAGGALAGGALGGGAPVVERTADLRSSIGGSGGPLPANGTGTFDVRVDNLGPDAADGTTIRVPASSGLRKWSANCAPRRGAGWTLSIAEIESGFVVPTLPAGDLVECVIMVTVTGSAGSSVTMSVTGTPPSGVSDPNPGNNVGADTAAIR
jgi:hypothetical protein